MNNRQGIHSFIHSHIHSCTEREKFMDKAFAPHIRIRFNHLIVVLWCFFPPRVFWSFIMSLPVCECVFVCVWRYLLCRVVFWAWLSSASSSSSSSSSCLFLLFNEKFVLLMQIHFFLFLFFLAFCPGNFRDRLYPTLVCAVVVVVVQVFGFKFHHNAHLNWSLTLAKLYQSFHKTSLSFLTRTFSWYCDFKVGMNRLTKWILGIV